MPGRRPGAPARCACMRRSLAALVPARPRAPGSGYGLMASARLPGCARPPGRGGGGRARRDALWAPTLPRTNHFTRGGATDPSHAGGAGASQLELGLGDGSRDARGTGSRGGCQAVLAEG